MKILTLWLWAFGFAINKVLGENNLEKTFYWFELNKEIVASLKESWKHPFFFEWYKLPKNIEIVDNYDDIIGYIDLLIIAIPAQFISQSIDQFKDKIKPGITILNLAKWIDIKTNSPISKLFEEKLAWKNYNYSILSWWMIAGEVVEGKMLGADLGIKEYVSNSNINQPHPNPLLWRRGNSYYENELQPPSPLREREFKGEVALQIKSLLQNKNLKIKIVEDILNVELYGSLKNIMAIMVWYYEWKGDGKSSIWFHLVNFYDEMKEIIKIYGWNPNIDFSYYSLGWDIVATCFWGSRNRYFGQLLGSWKNIDEVLEQLNSEKKHAEGYETLKAVYEKVKDQEWFEITKFLYNLIK